MRAVSPHTTRLASAWKDHTRQRPVAASTSSNGTRGRATAAAASGGRRAGSQSEARRTRRRIEEARERQLEGLQHLERLRGEPLRGLADRGHDGRHDVPRDARHVVERAEHLDRARRGGRPPPRPRGARRRRRPRAGSRPPPGNEISPLWCGTSSVRRVNRTVGPPGRASSGTSTAAPRKPGTASGRGGRAASAARIAPERLLEAGRRGHARDLTASGVAERGGGRRARRRLTSAGRPGDKKPVRSDQIKKGFERAPHRSLLRAVGLKDEDFDKPFVGIANSHVDIIPGHFFLQEYGRIAKEEIRKAGGVAVRVQHHRRRRRHRHGPRRHALQPALARAHRRLRRDDDERAHARRARLHPELRQDRAGHADGRAPRGRARRCSSPAAR